MNKATIQYLERNPDIDIAYLVYRLQELEQCGCAECTIDISISDALRAAGVPETEYARDRRLEMEAVEARAARNNSAIIYVRKKYPAAYVMDKNWEIYDGISRKVVFTGKDSRSVWQDFATQLGWKYEETKP